MSAVRTASAGSGRSVLRGDITVTAASQVSLALVSAVSTVVVSRSLGPSLRGTLAIAVLVPGVLQVVCALGAPLACVYLAGRGEVGVRELSRAATQLALIGSALGFCLAAAIGVSGGAFVAGPSPAETALATSALPFALFSASLIGILRGTGRNRAAAGVDLLQGSISAAGAALAVLLHRGVPGVLAGIVLGPVVAAATAFILLRPVGATLDPRCGRAMRTRVMRYGVRADVGNVMHLVSFRFDAVLVNAYVGSAALGVYSVATRMAEMLFVLPYSVAVVVLPRVASGGAGNRQTPRLFALTLLGTTAVASIVAIVSTQLVPLLFGHPFADASRWLLILLPGVVAFGSSQVLVSDVAGRGRPGLITVTAAVGLVLTVLLDLVAVPRWGVAGAAWVSSISFVVTAALALVFHLRVSRSSLATFLRAAASPLPHGWEATS